MNEEPTNSTHSTHIVRMLFDLLSRRRADTDISLCDISIPRCSPCTPSRCCTRRRVHGQNKDHTPGSYWRTVIEDLTGRDDE
jgi:hypothetical protein